MIANAALDRKFKEMILFISGKKKKHGNVSLTLPSSSAAVTATIHWHLFDGKPVGSVASNQQICNEEDKDDVFSFCLVKKMNKLSLWTLHDARVL